MLPVVGSGAIICREIYLFGDFWWGWRQRSGETGSQAGYLRRRHGGAGDLRWFVEVVASDVAFVKKAPDFCVDNF